MTSLLETASPVISLRPVRPEDEAHLFAVYSSTRVEELSQVDWTPAQRESFLRMQFKAQRQHYAGNYPGAAFQVIVVGGEPVGRLYVHWREHEIRIMDVALLPEFRGLGIGTRLLQDILAEGRRTERRVTIHVESFNPAQRLYARMGFVKVGSNGVYHLMEWRPGVVSADKATPVESEVV